MDRVDENKRGGAMRPTAIPEIGQKRRALRDIKNFIPERELLVKSKSSSNDKNPTFAANRPITRSFASTRAEKSSLHDQDVTGDHETVVTNGHKKSHNSPPIQSSSGLASSNVMDVDDKEQISELANTELKEVKTENVVTETAPDIDSCDTNNPLAVVEYVDEIYRFYRQTEVSGCVSPDYMSNQLDINEKMRAILIDWLIEVHYKFKLMDETLFLTVNVIDRFLSKQMVVRNKLQLVGVTAMLLACKYEEICVPVLEDLILISDRAYTKEEILMMEMLMVNKLEFNMSVPTPYIFIRRFLKAAKADRKLELLSFFIIELCLVEYKMLKFRPSLLAAASVYTAECTIRGLKHWSKSTELHSEYLEEQLLECSKLMVDLHLNAGNGKITGVHRKYSTFKFGCVALMNPAIFLLES